MATVGISGALISDVTTKIHKMRDADVNQSHPTVDSIIGCNDDNRLAYKLHWGEYAHLKDIIPKDWMVAASELNIDVTFTMSSGNIQHARFKLSSLRDFYFRPTSSRDYYYTPRIELAQDDLAWHDEFPQMAVLKERLVAHIARSEAIADWEKVEANVLSTLRNCRSLNEALKLVPTLRMYIPKEYLDRHDAKVTRSKSETTLSLTQEQLDAMVAAAVSAKMAGARA